jgi:hypothetical protein
MKVKEVGNKEEPQNVQPQNSAPVMQTPDAGGSSAPKQKNLYYIIGGVLVVIIIVLVFFILKNNSDKNRNEADKESILQKKNSVTEQQTYPVTPPTQQSEQEKKPGLTGTYKGTIKDGTLWYVYILNSDGNSFDGYNVIFWKNKPNGFKTGFTGTFDSQTNQVIMYEDRNAKGSGKFTGTVSDNGNTMHGGWFRYTDKGSFTWNLERLNEDNR